MFFLLFASACIAYLFKRQILSTKLMEFLFKEEAWNVALLLSLFSGVIFFLTSKLTIPNFVEARRAYEVNKLVYVEGRVTDYSPMPWAGHQDEYFKVKDTHFTFSNYESEPGYHNAASHGGVIRPNLYVRIGYYDDGYRKRILTLETE
jgi:hypothetical protein